MTRTLAVYLLVLLAAGCWGVCGAQVGPSRENVKRVAPAVSRPPRRKPQARPRPVAPRRAAPVPRITRRPPVRRAPRTVTARPPRPRPQTVRRTSPPARREAPVARRTPPVDPAVAARLQAARQWLAGEGDAAEATARALPSLAPPDLSHVRAVPAPSPAPTPAPELHYRQRVTLRFVREDGAPLESGHVRHSGTDLAAVRSANVLELDGPRAPAGQSEVQLELPSDWEFMSPGDAQLSLREYPGEETRKQLAPRPQPRPAPAAGPAPLFESAEVRDAFRAAVPDEAPAPPRETGDTTFPTPAALTRAGVDALVEARRLMQRAAPVTRDAALEARRAAWLDLDRAVRRLAGARLTLQQALDALQVVERGVPGLADLGDAHKPMLDAVRVLLATARVRTAQYLAEAEWQRAEYENPAVPDRAGALQVLRGALDGVAGAPAVQTQLARYEEVARAEAAGRAGEPGTRGVPQVEVTHHLTRTLQVRRMSVDLWLAERDLRPEDQVTLANDPGRKIDFKLQSGAWRATVPRSLLKEGDSLRVVRTTPSSELTADAAVERLDPYAPEGNQVARAPMQLTRINSFSITNGPDETIGILEELEPTAKENAKLRAVRIERAKAGGRSLNGGWWVRSRSLPTSFRLRPSPYPGSKEKAKVEGGAVDDVFRKVTRPEEANQKLLGRVIVDAVRLEAPFSGNVAGVRVGMPAQTVENALGGTVPDTGVVRYLGDSVAVALRGGVVEHMEIYRNLKSLVGQPIPPLAAGGVAAIDYKANRLRVRGGPGFAPPVGAEFLIVVSGKTLPVLKNGERYRAVVLEQAGADIICKVVRKDKEGKLVADASVEVLRILPAAESGTITLRPAKK